MHIYSDISPVVFRGAYSQGSVDRIAALNSTIAGSSSIQLLLWLLYQSFNVSLSYLQWECTCFSHMLWLLLCFFCDKAFQFNSSHCSSSFLKIQILKLSCVSKLIKLACETSHNIKQISKLRNLPVRNWRLEFQWLEFSVIKASISNKILYNS